MAMHLETIDEEINQLQAEVKTLRQENNNLQNDISNLRSKNDMLKDNIRMIHETRRGMKQGLEEIYDLKHTDQLDHLDAEAKEDVMENALHMILSELENELYLL